MNKLLLGTLFALLCINTYADDLKVADDFKSGDLVSADTFNQIFATIEKVNRTVVDSDLVGVWSCSAVHLGNSSFDATGWTKKDFIYELSTSQVNFTASSSSTSKEGAYTFTTSSPSPFWRKSSSSSNSADAGTYILYDGMLVTKNLGGINEAYPLSVEVVSDTRIILTALWKANELSERIVCDSAEAVPASPTSPTATNNKTGINLAWTDASSDETGFKIYRKLSSETEAKVIATQTAATYSDTDLTEGQTAYYQVVAYNDNGESAKSKTVSATLDSIAPTLIAVTPINGATLTDADADFTGGGGGEITITLTFSEEITVPCEGSTGGANSCVGDSAVKFKGLNNTYGFLNQGTTGTTFSTTIPFTPSFGSNPDNFMISVSGDKIQDKNGNAMETDFSSTFSLTR